MDKNNFDKKAYEYMSQVRAMPLNFEQGVSLILFLLFVRCQEIEDKKAYLENLGITNGAPMMFDWTQFSKWTEFDPALRGVIVSSTDELRRYSQFTHLCWNLTVEIQELKTIEDVSGIFNSVTEFASARIQHSWPINDILAWIIKTRTGRVFVPSFWNWDIVQKLYSNGEELAFYWNESNAFSFGLAQMRFAINWIKGTFNLWNSVETDPDDYQWKFDFAFVVPPFWMRYPSHFAHPGIQQKYWTNRLWDGIWPSIIIDSLKEWGKWAVVLPIGSTFSSRNDFRKMRKEIISKGYLETVIALPSWMLSNTSLSTAIYLINKTKNNRKVQFIDGRSSAFASGASISRIKKDEQHEFTREIIAICQLGASNKIPYKTVTTEEIEACDYNLDPKTYILNLEEKESRKESLIESIAQINDDINVHTNYIVEKSNEQWATIAGSVNTISWAEETKEILTKELVELEGEKAKINRENEKHKTLQGLKVSAFQIVVIVMSAEIALTYTIFSLVWLGYLNFSELTLNTFIGATITQITVIFYWIIKHLFPAVDEDTN